VKISQENVFITYNKSRYVAGETIWYKAFLFSAGQVSEISSNLNVELLNVHKSVIARQRIPIIKGIAEGAIDLPDSLSEQICYFRAYTGWMLNFDESLQYIHPIPIYNPNSKFKLKPNPAACKVTASVEGGSLLKNTMSRVSVRLHSNRELPEHWHGYLTDSQFPDQKILSFQSMDENIAQFDFTPIPEKNTRLLLKGFRTLILVVNYQRSWKLAPLFL